MNNHSLLKNLNKYLSLENKTPCFIFEEKTLIQPFKQKQKFLTYHVAEKTGKKDGISRRYHNINYI